MFTFSAHSENLKPIVRYIVLCVKTPSRWLCISFIYLQKLNVFLIFSYCNHIKLWQLRYHKVFTTVEKTWISVQCVIWKYKFLPYGLYNWMDRIRYKAEILKNKAECIWCRQYDMLLQWGSVKLCSEFVTGMDLGRKADSLGMNSGQQSSWVCFTVALSGKHIVLCRRPTRMSWYNELYSFIDLMLHSGLLVNLYVMFENVSFVEIFLPWSSWF